MPQRLLDLWTVKFAAFDQCHQFWTANRVDLDTIGKVIDQLAQIRCFDGLIGGGDTNTSPLCGTGGRFHCWYYSNEGKRKRSSQGTERCLRGSVTGDYDEFDTLFDQEMASVRR